MLSISELKGQRVASGSSKVLLLILDLAKNLVLNVHTATASSQELLSCIAQKRVKMMQFFASGCKGASGWGFAVANKLNEGMIYFVHY